MNPIFATCPSTPSPTEVPMQPCVSARPSTPSSTEVSMNPSPVRPSTPTEVPMPPKSALRRHRSVPSNPTSNSPSFRERRTLTLKSLVHGLSEELDLLAPRYAATASAALSPYPTLPILLARLTDPSQRGCPSHGELVCTLIAIHQSTPHRLWAAILLRTFRPMIKRTFKKLVGSDREERLALLLTSFLEVLGRVDPHRDPLRIGMYVRQATRARVFSALGVERNWEEIGFGVEADEEPDTESQAKALAFEWLRDTAEADRELVGTSAEHGALWRHVLRAHPSLERCEHLRIYRQLRYRRKRLLAELQEHLGCRPSAAVSSEVCS
jgi:hypothetical protein